MSVRTPMSVNMVVIGVISILLRKPAVVFVWNNMIEAFDDTVDLITHLTETLMDAEVIIVSAAIISSQTLSIM